MIDLSDAFKPKSDQLNADDLIGGPKIITITRVVNTGKAEQPVHIFFEGDEGKPWKPSKGMGRVLIGCWGKNGADYVGRRVEIFRNPDIKFGKDTVGGIQVSRVSDILGPVVIALTVSRGKRIPFVVRPIEPAPAPEKKELTIEDRRQKTIDLMTTKGVHVTGDIIETVNACESPEQLKAVFEALTTKETEA